jgi:LmbE family N-acetylglucosaminyl deacetylase
MITLWNDRIASSVRHILCLGAHCDDIEIGCGGTILKILEHEPPPAVTWVVLTSDARRRAEALASAREILHAVKQKEIVVRDFQDGFLPYSGEAVKSFFEEMKRNRAPDPPSRRLHRIRPRIPRRHGAARTLRDRARVLVLQP